MKEKTEKTEKKTLPERKPDKHCNARRIDRNTGDHIGYCGRSAGWGIKGVKTGRCRDHGGASLAGPESPRWKHGLYSQFHIPEHLHEMADRWFKDPDTFKLQDQGALLRTRSAELQQELWVEDGPAFRLAIQAAWDELIRCETDPQIADEARASMINNARAEIELLIKNGVRRDMLWEDIFRVGDRLAKHAKTETDNTMKKKYFYTIDQIDYMMQFVVSTLAEELDGNPDKRDAIFARLKTIPTLESEKID